MKRKNILKIGLVIVISFTLSGISFTPSADTVEETEYWSLIFSTDTFNVSWFGACDYLVRVLKSAGWKDDNIRILKDENASIANLVSNLTYIADHDSPNDITLICIFTHGDEFDHDAFLDYTLIDNMTYVQLDENLSNLDSEGIGIIIDACFSFLAIEDLQKEGRFIATSTNKDRHGHGFFGNMMAMGFDEFGDYCVGNDTIAPSNRDGIVSIEEACNYSRYEGYRTIFNQRCAYQDNYTGDLEIISINRDDGYIDQISNYTSFWKKDYLKVQTCNTQGKPFSQVAQSFKPKNCWMTKLRLRVGWSEDYVPTTPLIVSIRDEIDGLDLESVEINPSDKEYFEEYIICDFEGIELVPNDEYFIVCRTDKAEYYLKYYKIYVHDEHYQNGSCLVSNESSDWTEVDPPIDTYFVTYGFDSRPPSSPMITGPASGEAGVEIDYKFNASDPDGDDVNYYIDWGDNTNEWTGFYESGIEVTVSHTWEDKGSYNITAKAVDVNGVEGPWGQLTVEMPVEYNQGCVHGTQVTLVFGVPGMNTKNIEDIEIGDRILSYDPVNLVVTPAEVIGVYEFTEGLIENNLLFNYNLEVTPKHNLYINRTEWMKADDARLGFFMLENPPGRSETYPISINSKMETSPAVSIYDLIVQPVNDDDACGYWANGILVGGYE